MSHKLEIIKELNTLIETLILHGGDAGGPYFTGEEEAKIIKNDILNGRRISVK